MENEAEMLVNIEKALNLIIDKKQQEISFETVYRNVYALVSIKSLKKIFKLIESKLFEIANAEPKAKFSIEFCENFMRIAKNVGDIMIYADRASKKNESYIAAVPFCMKILETEYLSPRLELACLEFNRLLNLTRNEQSSPIGSLKCICSVFNRIGSVPLSRQWKSAILVCSDKYLDTALAVWSSDFPSLIVKKSLEFLRVEKMRSNELFDNDPVFLSNWEALYVQKICVTNFDAIVNMPEFGLKSLLLNDRIQELSEMFQLFQKADAVMITSKAIDTEQVMKISFKVAEAVREICSPLASSESICGFVLIKKRSINWLKSMGNCKAIQNMIDKEISTSVNRLPKCAELLAYFIDDLLRKITKNKESHEQLESDLDASLDLFKLIHDKDIFEKIHKIGLARRLLSQSFSRDHEEQVLAKIKVECGFQFTFKLEGMLRDILLSQDMDHSLDILHPTVLTSAHWPFQLAADQQLPPVLKRHTDKFDSTYAKRHSGRKLGWLLNMGTAEMLVKFNERDLILVVSTMQMIVLLCFNDRDGMSLDELMVASRLKEPLLRRILDSLSTEKIQILIQTGQNFSFNHEFTSKAIKVRLPQFKLVNESSQVEKQITEDRRFAIEACVVRIMKSKQKLPHSNLIADVTIELAPRFPVQVSDIKKAIESLIDRDFLLREECQYTYVA